MEKRNNLREFLFTVWYSLVSKLDKNADVQFMNYGYTSPDLDVSLESNNEDNRYPIQLYHQIASKADLSGKDILEVGCGRGGGLAYLVESFSPRSAVGVDLNQNAVLFCTKYYKLPGLTFTRANAELLPFEDNSQDFVINVESSHRYENMSSFMSEVRRVLRPGGQLLITDFRHNYRMPHLRKTFAESGLHQLLEEFITPMVVHALEKDDSRRRLLVRKLVPWYLHRTALNFAAVKGTRTFNNFAQEKMLYFNYVLQKRQYPDL